MDLNADLGESFGAWRMGDDEALLTLVSSANVACGFHAGDPLTMLGTIRAAVVNKVRIGAHVSYRDLAGFGRRAMDIGRDELYGDVLYQLAALDGMARAAGGAVSYVKPHGALYNRIVHDAAQAKAVGDAVRDFDPRLPMLGLAGSKIAAVAAENGQRFVREAFVDRGYRPDGTLVPRGEAGALLLEPEPVARRAVQMAVSGTVTAVDGTVLTLEVDSLCVHGDSPGAVGMARAVRAGLQSAKVPIAAFC
ncbi:LamB/YcsF family protein [Paenarthrobacter sp. Z7-10]|uniref:LamB/YcsF family protein n=1 Tax=Paenarthrobacter sp. Z7-10 TaxID=2787635 RepID=UPI0022A917BA|nr:5-oxoprolinase subunit PxpA [Paenarthrobacter sp. Z7-10]MCZ2403374.1 LamB/YcsF family protein [Paenarthrobacter sp. Z7-10]